MGSHDDACRGDILVVDDTPANLRLLSELLQEAGYRVRAVTSGTRALEVLRLALPDLILLDVRLPDLDGFTVCARLKTIPQAAAIPVIFISALNETEAKVGAFQSGGVDYITKPINPDEVLARVSTHLSLRELHRRLEAANTALFGRLAELEQTNAHLKSQIAARRAAEETSARLLEHERRRALRLNALREAMTAIAGALDLPTVYQAVVEQAATLFGSSYGALARAVPSTREMRIVAVHGLPSGLVGLPVPFGTGMIGTAAANRQVVSSAGPAPPLLAKGDALAAPLLAGDRLEGVVVVANPEGGPLFDTEDTRLFNLFAPQAAIAVQNAGLFEEVRHLARTDPLTGIFNRRHFFELASRELERVRRVGGALAVLLMDIDHFKHVNDTYGHQVGDRALRAVADLCRDGLRAADISARYGGEELVVLLPDTNLSQAALVAERLRGAIATRTLETDQDLLQLTASFGVAALEGPDVFEHLDTLLARADEALYAAKRAGRDRVHIWAAACAANADA